MIQARSLTRLYGDKIGVQDIDFSVEQGEIVGLLGPNGSGKTTILKMLAGCLPPSSGSVTVDGFDILEAPKQATSRIGFLPENPPLYPEMRVGEYLAFVADIKAVNRRQRQARVARTMEMARVVEVKDRLIRNLSKGYKQRVGLAQAMVSDPPILILDEPTVGLDPRQINEVRQLIVALGKQRTVILSSHILAEVSMICRRLIILNRGRIAAMDTTETLTSGVADTGRFLLTVKGAPAEAERLLGSVAGILSLKEIQSPQQLERGCCSFIVENEKDHEVREHLFRLLAANTMPIIELRSLGRTLEEIFLQLTEDNAPQRIEPER
jgi:ABC-2 type transport system ATP-binding protein